MTDDQTIVLLSTCCLGGALLCAVVLYLLCRQEKPQQKAVPHWEAVPDDREKKDDKDNFWRVRWSEQDARGRWLYVGHYGGNSPLWNRHAAEQHAERLNEQLEKPWAMSPHWATAAEEVEN